MKRKELGRYHWKNVWKRRDCHCCWEANGLQGEAELIHILQAAKKGIGCFRGEDVVIYQDDFYWLQIAIPGVHWWLTVMLDAQGQIVQYYFDITLENHLLQSPDSWFWDLYLDVVMMPDGRMDLLDEEELLQALAEGEISRQQFQDASMWADDLMAVLPSSRLQLQQFCMALFEKLKKKEEETADIPDLIRLSVDEQC